MFGILHGYSVLFCTGSWADFFTLFLDRFCRMMQGGLVALKYGLRFTK